MSPQLIAQKVLSLVEDYLVAGKKRPAGDKAWAATSDAVHAPAMNRGVKW